MAPEMACGLPYNYKVDIWNLGVILWIMLFNKYPFGNSAHDNTVYENIVKGCDPEFSIEEAFKIQVYNYIYNISDKVKDLFKKIFV